MQPRLRPTNTHHCARKCVCSLSELGSRFFRRHHCSGPSRVGFSRPACPARDEVAVFADAEAGDRIVVGIDGKQEASIRREDDALRALTDYASRVAAIVKAPGTGAARQTAFRLGDRAVRRPQIVDDGVPGLVCLHVEMSVPAHRAVTGWCGHGLMR